jgi:hypothetical protein
MNSPTTADELIAKQNAEIARLKKQVAKLKKANEPKLPPADKDLVNRYKRFAKLMEEEPYLWTIRWWVDDNDNSVEAFNGHFSEQSPERKHAILIAYNADPRTGEHNRIPESEWYKYIEE